MMNAVCVSIRQVSLAFGLAYAAVAYGIPSSAVVGPSSSAACSVGVGLIQPGIPHVVPGVTLAMLATRRVSLARAALYFAGQLAGAVVGAGLARLMLTGVTATDPTLVAGLTVPARAVSEAQAFGVEFVASFLFVLVVFRCNDDGVDGSGDEDDDCNRKSSSPGGSRMRRGGGGRRKNDGGRRRDLGEQPLVIGLVFTALSLFAVS